MPLEHDLTRKGLGLRGQAELSLEQELLTCDYVGPGTPPLTPKLSLPRVMCVNVLKSTF